MRFSSPLAFGSLVALVVATAFAFGAGCTENKIVYAPSSSSGGEEDDAGTSEDGDVSLSDAAPPPAGAVRVATYNVRNFFDTVCDTGQCGSNDYEQQLSASSYEVKASMVANAIRRIGSDVVLLQEIEKDACLQTLAGKLNNAYPNKHLGEINFNGSVDVAILSKDPIVEIRTHRQNKFKLADNRTVSFAREFLEVDLDRKGTVYTVFVAHFKAKADDDPALRLGEAKEGRRILQERVAASPGRLILLGGDLNDDPGSPPINALTADNAFILAERRDLSGAAAYTEFSAGKGFAIDHLVLPGADAERHVKGSTRIVQDAANKGLGGSDHVGLVADFLVSKP